MERTCISCAALLGCKLLSDTKGKFVPERVVKSPDECSSWVEVGALQKRVRDTMYGLQGENSLRVLHQLPDIVMKPLMEQEGLDEMIVDVPDFAGMLWEGMTSAERDDQLRYETNENGSVTIDEDGNKRPRSTLVLRKFACDPESHIQLDHSVGMFWSTDQVIKHILAVEVEQGLLIRAKKSKQEKQEPVKPAAKAAQKETKMAGKRVLITPKGKAAPAPAAAAPSPGPKTGGKVARPPARRGAPPAQVEEQEAAVQAPDVDLAAMAEDIALKVAENVNNILIEKVNVLQGRLDELEVNLLDAITIMHDMLVQTGGTMQFEDENGQPQSLPEQFQNEKKILAYLDDAGE